MKLVINNYSLDMPCVPSSWVPAALGVLRVPVRLVVALLLLPPYHRLSSEYPAPSPAQHRQYSAWLGSPAEAGHSEHEGGSEAAEERGDPVASYLLHHTTHPTHSYNAQKVALQPPMNNSSSDSSLPLPHCLESYPQRPSRHCLVSNNNITSLCL